MDAYLLAAQFVYMAAAMATALGAVAFASRRMAAVKAALNPTAVRWALVVAAGQAVVSGVAIAMMLAGSIDTRTGTAFVANWCLALPAAVILPAAMLLDDELRTSRERNNRTIIVGATLAVAISTGVLALAALFPDSIREGGDMARIVASPEARALLWPLALMAAPIEEVIFRGGVQGFGEKFLAARGMARWPAVAVASLLWAVGHAGAMEPAGIKEAQIFAIGLVLGWLRMRAGLRGAILAHLALNGLLVAVDIAGVVGGWHNL